MVFLNPFRCSPSFPSNSGPAKDPHVAFATPRDLALAGMQKDELSEDMLIYEPIWNFQIFDKNMLLYQTKCCCIVDKLEYSIC